MHTHTTSSLSPEPNKSVRPIQRAGRPNVGVKHAAEGQHRLRLHRSCTLRQPPPHTHTHPRLCCGIVRARYRQTLTEDAARLPRVSQLWNRLTTGHMLDACQTRSLHLGVTTSSLTVTLVAIRSGPGLFKCRRSISSL